MKVRALASDYDGTLATNGRVDDPTVEALEKFRRSGRMLLLVTGRIQEDLLSVFPAARLFSRLILENGAVIARPETGRADVLGRRPPEEFVRRLRDRGVAPLAVGRVVVASTASHRDRMLAVIREMGLDLHLVFNRDSAMVLPSGVTKASGLDAALQQVKVSWSEVVGVGDAENDEGFLKRCGRSVAVANALPELRNSVDEVTRQPEGAGVVELVDRLLSSGVAVFPEEMTS